jgi:polysaccharide deacetylase 2 family uncharacterized protein YibQ
MAAAKKSTARKKSAPRRKRAASAAAPSRKLLAGGMLALGLMLGIGVGFGITLLPPAPTSQPVALDVPLPQPVEQAALEPAPAPKKIEPVEPVTPEITTEAAAPAKLPISTPAQASQPVSQIAAAPVPMPSDETLPLWRRNAVSYQDPGDRPMLAIVLDDVGVAPQHAEEAMALPPPIVMSIMTYAPKADLFAREARSRGHEVMVHMPMEPISGSVDPGPEALVVGLSDAEIRRRVDWGLTRFAGYVGFNNHMGSRFTQDAAGMRVVLDEARSRGLLFLDSKTIAGSVGDRLAGELGVTHIARDVFLDDVITEAAITRQLAAAEAMARSRGYAVAIGHPHPATIAVLKRSLPELAARGIAVVPLTAIVKKRDGVSG